MSESSAGFQNMLERKYALAGNPVCMPQYWLLECYLGCYRMGMQLIAPTSQRRGRSWKEYMIHTLGLIQADFCLLEVPLDDSWGSADVTRTHVYTHNAMLRSACTTETFKVLETVVVLFRVTLWQSQTRSYLGLEENIWLAICGGCCYTNTASARRCTL